jgi:hypothetical protein
MAPIYPIDAFCLKLTAADVPPDAAVWIAIALRGGTVPVNEPLDTVILNHGTNVKKKKKNCPMSRTLYRYIFQTNPSRWSHHNIDHQEVK